MATKKTTLQDVEETMLATAKILLEANQSPSNELQIKILNSANELVKTVKGCKADNQD